VEVARQFIVGERDWIAIPCPVDSSIQASLRDSRITGSSSPAMKSLGYFQSSLRDRGGWSFGFFSSLLVPPSGVCRVIAVGDARVCE
jgi:hypothetical protein